MAKSTKNKREPRPWPNQVYVWTPEPDEDYILANDKFEEIENGTKVGVYKLVEVRTKKTTHSLE